METENNTSTPMTALKEKTQPLFCVTKTSKYFALVLFVMLPFLGGYVGYTIDPLSEVEVETLVKISAVKELSSQERLVEETDIFQEIYFYRDENKKMIEASLEDFVVQGAYLISSETKKVYHRADYMRFKNGQIRELKAIEDLDFESFVVLKGEAYAKDKNSAYFYPENALNISDFSNPVVILPNVDSVTFETNSFHEVGKLSMLAKDKDHLYSYGKIVSGVDIDSFELKNGTVATDRSQVYLAPLGALVVENADPKTYTFEYWFGPKPAIFGRDANSCFFNTGQIDCGLYPASESEAISFDLSVLETKIKKVLTDSVETEFPIELLIRSIQDDYYTARICEKGNTIGFKPFTISFVSRGLDSVLVRVFEKPGVGYEYEETVLLANASPSVLTEHTIDLDSSLRGVKQVEFINPVDGKVLLNRSFTFTEVAKFCEI